MNPGKNKVWDSEPEFSFKLCDLNAKAIFSPGASRSFAMNAMLVVALVVACLVNVASVLGHLGSVAG